jgi:hypothetical protein
MNRKGAWKTRASVWRSCVRAAAGSVAASGIVATWDKISIDPKIGPTMVASELNAWARVSRLDACSGAPSMDVNGLAATCTMVTPLARMNKAPRKPG